MYEYAPNGGHLMPGLVGADWEDGRVSTAYIDESERTSASDGRRVYLMSATIPFDDIAVDAQRAAMLDLLPPNRAKVRWYGSVDAQKLAITETIAGLEVMHCTVVRVMDDGESSKRARAKCIETLAFELMKFDVDRAIFESRTTGQDNDDLKTLNYLRLTQVAPSAFRALHVAGAQEPLLWMSDAVAGAVGDRELLGLGEYASALAHQLNEIRAA